MSTFTLFFLLTATLSTFAAEEPELRAYWAFDEGAGTRVADVSGNGNVLTATGVTWVGGAVNGGVELGADGTIECLSSDTLCPSRALTLEAWIKPQRLDYEASPVLVHKQGSYSLRFTPEQKLSLTVWLDGQPRELTSRASTWQNDQWQHVAATYDGKTLALYAEGQRNASLQIVGGKRLDASDAPCYLGSLNGRSRFTGQLDEVRLFGRALSPEEVRDSYRAGVREIERLGGRFNAFFSKAKKRPPEEVVPGFLWIDAEDFLDYGGWWMDTQFVPQMGSPYLIAAGIGTPVADAWTTVTVPAAGKYRLWVRSRNWLKEFSPGRFKVSVAGKASTQTFGVEKSGQWAWQDGGVFELKPGEVDLALTDLTGYYGRCDALLLTRDLSYQPPAELEAYKRERARLTGTDVTETTVGDFDVIVVGAGVAGCNAAIAAARNGAKTALIQDRPMLGGNNSLELGVPLSGPANWGKPNARASGLNEEINRIRAHHFLIKWSQAAELVAAREPNLKVFLNTHVDRVDMGPGKTIRAVGAFDMLDGRRTRYTGKMFVDCTGDGWVGYYAGAEYMLGRESRDEFGESNAPEKADNITMSGCLMAGRTLGYRSVDTGAPAPFVGPEWLWDLTPNTAGLEARKDFESSLVGGKWWHENRGEVDDLWDPEGARDGLIRLVLSYWNWIKNHSSLKDKAANRKLQAVPINNAKRETRRLVGDHILTQDEVLRAEPFPDRVAHAGWGLDIHHPEGLFAPDGPFDYNTRTPLHNIPFRILYSKNIPNLLFAGRDVSVTHVALGTVRVQDTTGVMGQAAGTGAALCIKQSLTPRQLYQTRIKELQQQLLKDDQYIIGVKNEDPADLARAAQVTASSTMPALLFTKDDVVETGVIHDFTCDRAVMFKRGLTTHFGKASVLLVSNRKTPCEMVLRLRGASKWGDFSSLDDLAVATATVPPGAKSWVTFDLDCEATDDYLWLTLPRTEGIAWVLMKSAPLGSCRAYGSQGGTKWTVIANQYYAFHFDEPIRHPAGCEPSNVINGVARTVGDQSNMWRSDPAQPLPQWIQLDLGEPKQFNSIYLTFDTNLNKVPVRSLPPPATERFVPESVSDYKVQAQVGGQWKTLAEVANNYQRRRLHRFPAVTASRVRVIIEKTNGDKSARVFEIRLYDE